MQKWPLPRRTAYPALAELASHIGDPAVRNRGTIGGSLANNDPAACYPAAALGSGATIVTNTPARSLPMTISAACSRLRWNEGEIITAVRFPVPEKAQLPEVPAARIAVCPMVGGLRAAKYAAGVRVAVTGASEEGVFRWHEAEAALDANFAPDALDGLSVDAGGMIGDLHGSKEYRAHLVGVMAKRAVAAAG